MSCRNLFTGHMRSSRRCALSRLIIIVSIVAFVIIAVGIAPAALCQSSAPSAPEELAPSDLHRILGEAKAAALDRSRRALAAAAAMPEADQTNYDVKWYDITIRVNDTTEILYGVVTFNATAVVDNVLQVIVNLYSGMTVDGIDGPSGALSYSRTTDFVVVTLDRTYNAGEEFTFDFHYSGHPTEGGLQAFSFDWFESKRSITTLSEPYFAHTWWPCKDLMEDKPDSIGIHIEVDTSLYCASNGTLDSITTGSGSNSRAFHYTCHYPIATYLFSIAIAPYVVWQNYYVYNDGLDSMPVIYHVYSSYEALSRTTWVNTPSMITALASVYGPYPFPTEKYGHANFNWGGAMEHQTCTSMGGGTFGFGTMVTVHELSHQWWGDMVTCKSWHDIWLNEGWASYAEAQYKLVTEGWASYRTYMNGMAYKGSGTVWCGDTTSVNRIFSGSLSYDKGAWVVHMLRGYVGEENFAAGIEAYRNEFAFKSATTPEFQDVWERTTGVDLDLFMAQWVYGQYCPTYNYYYMSEPSDTGGYDTYLVVKQVQTTQPSVYQMPVEFFFDYASAPDDTLTLTVDERSELFKFHQSSTVASITLDPAGWILKTATNPAWRLFIVTLDSEVSNGFVGQAYQDTIQVRASSMPDTVIMASGALPPGLTVNKNGLISGTPTTAGVYTFMVVFANRVTGYSDSRTYDIEIIQLPCCTGMVGNVNGSVEDEPTIGDVSTLIDMLFISGAQVDCLTEGDINQSGGSVPTRADITISDISMLIDHLFISGITLPSCP
jgi:aminopeptidase N